MKNQLTFAHVTGALLDNKIKTYPQHRLVRDLFSLCLLDEASDYSEASDDNITFSRWCNGARPVPVDILNEYKNDTGRNQMITDFKNKIIPNLINVSNTRYLLEDMINNSRKIIGITKADELIAIDDNATFFTDVMLYAILSDHNRKNLYSPELTDILLSNRLPAVVKEFIGRNDEIKECGRLLASESVVFINGIAGIGKSELAKYYASRNKKKYTNIIYLFYSDSLRKDIAAMEFSDDTSDMDEDALFDSHYRLLRSLHQDSLVILDNFNALPKDDAFFKEFVKNDFELLVTTRCEVKQYASIKIKEIASEKDLLQLFASHCPYSDDDTETVKQIIREVHSHTLTVVLSALSLAAGGLEPDELLHELKQCGLNITDSENVELYKDGDYYDGLMIEHLRILMQISRLNSSQTDILKNLSILPVSGVYKNHFRNWLQLASLHDVNYLARYGFITDDIENKKINLHPLIQEIIYEELNPCISNCQTLVNSLHSICLMHGLEVRKPDNTIQAMISVVENIINDSGYIFLSAKNITTGKINWNDIMYIPKSLHDELYSRVSPKMNDILLAKNGTTGVAAIVDRECEFDIYVTLALLRVVNNNISSQYLLKIIASDTIQDYFKSSLKGIGVPNLHLEHIRTTLIPIPPINEQNKIAERIYQYYSLLDSIVQNIE